MSQQKRYDVRVAQPGWKRCPKCGRDGFRPPWQGYCYDCNNAYQRARRYRLKAQRTAFENRQAIESWHETQRLLAIDKGIDPDTIELTLPPWLDPALKVEDFVSDEYRVELLGPPLAGDDGEPVDGGGVIDTHQGR